MIKKREHQIGVGGVHIGEMHKKYVNEVLDKNWLSYGPFSQKFEYSFAKEHGCRYAVLVNSGTSALRIAVAALKEHHKWKDCDEIIVPALTFVASSNVIIMNNLTPVFVDVDPQYYNIDPSKIESKITPKTRAIMVVNLFGQPADMDPILKIAKKHNLKIIEDSCETMFAKYKGRVVGSFSDISCFSTYACHILVTGVGGLALTNNPDYYVTLRSLANHGRDSIYVSMDDDKGKTGKELRTIMERRFSFVRLGYSFRATEMEAALGVAELEKKDEYIRKRKQNAAFLTNGLNKWKHLIQLPETVPGAEHVFMMYPIVIKDARIKRDDLTFFLEEHNIETRGMVPLINQPVYKTIFGDLEKENPVAARINNNGFYIGCHPFMKEDDLKYIVELFDDFFNQKIEK
jgi:dTDP-4-amino-4,6-dideoxygalactose transaminase